MSNPLFPIMVDTARHIGVQALNEPSRENKNKTWLVGGLQNPQNQNPWNHVLIRLLSVHDMGH
jgi:hypothetical protein